MMVCPQCGKRYPEGTTLCEVDGQRLAPLAEDPYVGCQIDKYRLEKRIGRGGFGVVYLAQHLGLSNQVAVKILKKQFVTDEQLVERFRREARVSSQINHENVVQTLDFGYDNDLGFYYIMEYLDGISLTQLMKSYPQGMPSSRMLPILKQICLALDQAHAINVVHRDLKPSNIFLIKKFAQSDIVKVLDFGIAKVIQGEEGKGVTVTGQIVGSPRFMSPEQARGRHTEVDPRSDIYSLGVMVFWMLTGRLPFESKQLARLLYMHVKTPPPTLASVSPSSYFPPQLEQVVASALAKSKNERPPTAGDFYYQLEDACLSGSNYDSQNSMSSASHNVDPFGQQADETTRAMSNQHTGHSGHHTGHSGHHPGHSGHHPGHSGHHPRHSGHHPGHSGHHPGHSGQYQGTSGSFSSQPSWAGSPPPATPYPQRPSDYGTPSSPFIHNTADDEEEDALDQTRVDASASFPDEISDSYSLDETKVNPLEERDLDATLVGAKGGNPANKPGNLAPPPPTDTVQGTPTPILTTEVKKKSKSRKLTRRIAIGLPLFLVVSGAIFSVWWYLVR